MNTSIKNILTSWESSLIRFQKIDRWNYSENLATLGWYLHNNDCTIEEYYLIKYIRDSIIGVNFNVKSVLNAIQKLMNIEAAKDKGLTSMLVKMEGNRVVLNGQDVRFKKETEKIFKEKLKFKKGMMLRNFDIETEAPHDSKRYVASWRRECARPITGCTRRMKATKPVTGRNTGWTEPQPSNCTTSDRRKRQETQEEASPLTGKGKRSYHPRDCPEEEDGLQK